MGITAQSRAGATKVANRFSDDAPDEFDEDASNGSVKSAIRSGRVIMLGDGSEVLTDSDDAVFDDEQKDEKDDEALSKTTATKPEETKTVDTEMKDTSAQKPAAATTEVKSTAAA